MSVLAAVMFLGGCAGALNLPGSQRPASYTVHRGDTLYSIAWHYGLDYHTVARWNAIRYPYTIHPGERIHLHPGHKSSRSSGGGETPARAVAKAPVSKPANGSGEAPKSRSLTVHWQWPASGKVRATFGAKGIAGKGIVIDGKLGAPVQAAAAGTVVYAGDALVGYGRLVILKHNEEWLSAYAHNQRLLVHEGQTVQAGDKIATMGVAPDGEAALYFEIRKDGSPVNPLRFLSPKR